MKKIIQISVMGIMADFKNGIPDEELMGKYGLSEKGLQAVFERVLEAMCSGLSHLEVESDRLCSIT
jgi:hypothetical protein